MSENHISGVMVSMLPSSVVNCEFTYLTITLCLIYLNILPPPTTYVF